MTLYYAILSTSYHYTTTNEATVARQMDSWIERVKQMYAPANISNYSMFLYIPRDAIGVPLAMAQPGASINSGLWEN